MPRWRPVVSMLRHHSSLSEDPKHLFAFQEDQKQTLNDLHLFQRQHTELVARHTHLQEHMKRLNKQFLKHQVISGKLDGRALEDTKILQTDVETEWKKVNELFNSGKAKKSGLLDMIKTYGVPFFIWYATLYCGCGLGLYVALEQGWIGGGDALEWMKSIGLQEYVDLDKFDPVYGNMAVAFLLNELCETLRFPFVVATTPILAKKFRKQ